MTVRITLVEQGAMRHIRVEGRLTRNEVAELEQVIGDDLGAACLELQNLRSFDASGLAALRRLRAAGLQMRGVPPHLAWRIEDEEEAP